MDMILAMRVYARVVERGSISQAAKDLHMGQSSVSETLTRLEKYLAVRLLMRNPRAITCTDYGMTFYNHSKIVLAAAAEAIRAVTPTEDRLAGTLRLSSPCCFGETVVPELLALLYAAYPLLKIDLTLNDAIVDPVTEGVDISLRLGKLANGIFIAHPLGQVERKLVASAEYLRNSEAITVPEQLRHHPFIRVKGIFDGGDLILYDEDGVVVHTRINTVLATTHWSSIYGLVKRGIGIGVLQAPACMKEISNGEMVELLPGYHIPAFDLHALTPPQKPISPTINQVISFLKTTVPSLLAQYHASAINIRRG